MANRQPDWLLLDRFLAGECSPAEIEQVRRWLDEHPESAAALATFRETMDRRGPGDLAPPEWDVERAWARLDGMTRDEAQARYRLPPPLRRVDPVDQRDVSADIEIAATGSRRAPFDIGRALRVGKVSRLRVAAAFLLMLGGASVAVWHVTGGAPSRVAEAEPARSIVTQRSERADFRLRDGTHVVLAPESRLTIPAGFGVAHRRLALVGEGYFEVVHDSARPFLVRAAHGLVHDLGTRFSVRAYPRDSVVQVVVAEGRVVAGLAGAPRPPGGPVLGRGDLARLDTAGVTILVRNVDVDRYQSWTEGRLRFYATPLREVLPEIARWYDVELEIADAELGDRRLTITLQDEPLEQVLGALSQITGTRYERTGHVIRFVAARAAPRGRRRS